MDQSLEVVALPSSDGLEANGLAVIMDAYEEPESQVEADLHDECPSKASSPNSYQGPPHPDHQLASDGRGQFEDGDTRVTDTHASDIVDETQYDELEADTQVAKDSNQSFVADTQYDEMEADTQAVDELILAPAPAESTLPNLPKAAFEPAQQALSPVKLFARPSLDIATEDFKFGQAKKFTQASWMRPPPKPTNDAAGPQALTMPAPLNTEAARTEPTPTELARTRDPQSQRKSSVLLR